MGTHRQLTERDVGLLASAGTRGRRAARLDAPPTDGVPQTTTAIGANGAGLFAWQHRPNRGRRLAIQARTSRRGARGDDRAGLEPAFGSAGMPGREPPTPTATSSSATCRAPPQPAASPPRSSTAPARQQPPAAAAPPAAASPPTPRARLVTGSRLIPNRFAIGSGTPAALNQAGRRVRVGTTIRFVLSEDSRVRFLFERPTAGRRVGGRCVRQTRRNRRAGALHALGQGRRVHARPQGRRQQRPLQRALLEAKQAAARQAPRHRPGDRRGRQRRHLPAPPADDRQAPLNVDSACWPDGQPAATLAPQWRSGGHAAPRDPAIPPCLSAASIRFAVSVAQTTTTCCRPRSAGAASSAPPAAPRCSARSAARRSRTRRPRTSPAPTRTPPSSSARPAPARTRSARRTPRSRSPAASSASTGSPRDRCNWDIAPSGQDEWMRERVRRTAHVPRVRLPAVLDRLRASRSAPPACPARRSRARSATRSSSTSATPTRSSTRPSRCTRTASSTRPQYDGSYLGPVHARRRVRRPRRGVHLHVGVHARLGRRLALPRPRARTTRSTRCAACSAR